MNKYGTLDKTYHFGRKTKKSLSYRLNRRTSEIIRVIKEYASDPPGDIIDFGTADGLMLSKIKDSFPDANCTGIEYSKELLETVSDTRIIFKEGDVTCLDIPDNSFDIAIAAAIIEHLPEPQKMLTEAQRVLKYGGILILTSPDPFWEWAATLVGHLPGGQHNKVMNLTELSSLLRETGFDIIEQKKFMLSPIGMPFELLLEEAVRKAGLNFLFANQLITGKKSILKHTYADRL